MSGGVLTVASANDCYSTRKARAYNACMQPYSGVCVKRADAADFVHEVDPGCWLRTEDVATSTLDTAY
jgi:hypothetical protein